MAKGTTIGFLNFGIDGDNKELLKAIKQAEKEAISLDKFMSNMKIGLNTKSMTADVHKAVLSTDKLAISNNKVAKSAAEMALSETKAANQVLKDTQNLMYQEERLVGLRKRNSLIGVQGQKDLAAAYGLTNKTMFSQKNILQQLSSAMGIYFSIYQAGAFVKELAMVSGEFEKQRLSLRAIIQDSASADKIFNQIKDLAVYSPFNFKELTDYAKQLSAFSIPTNEIFDTMTRLADISAGLGVDMNRIILAYGQVRSASVLRGQELRQFTEAGIPLVDELAKKFGELEGRVVSAGDVFDKISNREVPFAMIKDIFTDLTSEGGKFYQMQEIQATSLAGKISNLRDAYDIMLDSIGSANSETLKGAVDALVGIMDNWRDYLNIIKTIVAAYGVYRATLFAINLVEKTNLAVKREAIILMRSYAAQNISLSKTQAVTAAQTELLTRKLNGLKSALSFNPAALALTGITVAIGLIASYVSHQQELEEQLFKTIHAINEESKSVNTHLDRLKELAKSTDSNSNASKERVKILNKLSEIEPTVAREIKNHADNLDLLTIAQEKYNNSINIRKFATYAANEGSGLFTSNLLETLKELNEAQNKADLYSSKLVLGYSKIEEALSRWNSEGKDVTGTMSDLQSSTLDSLNTIVSSSSNVTDKIIQIRKLAFNSSGNERIALFDLSNMIDEGSFNSWINSYQNLNKATSEADADINTFVQNLKGYLKVNNLDIKENENTIRSLIKSWDDLGLASQKQILLKLGIEWDGKENDESQLSEWQNLLQSKLGNTITIQTDTNINSVTEEMEKKYKELKTRIDKTKPILIKFGFDFDKNAFPSPAEISPVIKQLADSYIADQKDVTNLDAAAKSLGKTLKDLYEPKDKGEKKDKFTDNLKRQVEIVKAAKSEYEKLIKVMSREEAMNKIRGISEYSSIGNIDLSDQGYIDYLSEQLKKVESRNTTAAKNVRVTWNKELGQIQIEQITEKAQYEIDRIEKYLSNYKTDFDFYKRILGITGDKGQAAKLAFGANNPVKEYIDVLKEAFKKSSGVSFSDFVKLDDSNKLKLLVNKQTSSIFNQIEAAEKDEVVRRIGLLDEYRDYASKRVAIETKYNQDILSLQNLRVEKEKDGDKKSIDFINRSIAQATKQKGEELINLDFEQLKKTPEYVRAFENLKNTSTETLNSLLGQLEQAKQAAVQVLTPDQLREYTSTIESIMDELISRDIFGAIAELKREVADADKELIEAERQYNAVVRGSDTSMTEIQALTKLNAAKDKSVKKTNQLKEAEKKLSDQIEQLGKEIENVGNAIGGTVGEIISLMGSITNTVMFAVEGVKSVAAAAAAAISTVEKASVILAIIGAALQIATKIASLFAADYSEYEKAKGVYESYIAVLDKVIEKQKELVGTMTGENARNSYEYALELIKKQEAAAREIGLIFAGSGASAGSHSKGRRAWDRISEQGWNELAQWNKEMSGMAYEAKNVDWLFGLSAEELLSLQETAPTFWAQLGDDIGGYLQAIIDSGEATEELKKMLDETYTGLSFDSLKDSLDDLIQSTDTTFEAIGDSFEDHMQNAVLNFVKNKYLTTALEEWYSKFADAYSDGVLSDTEVNELRQMYEEVYNNANNMYDSAIEAAGINKNENSADKDTLSKGAQALTEDTGDLIASYMNAMRADLAAQKQFVQQLVSFAQLHTDQFANMYAELLRIQVNTLATANNTLAIANTTDATYRLLKAATIRGSGTVIQLS